MTLPFFDPSLTTAALVLLAVSLTIALGFEFVNGFHDTANAVATVIYTKSLTPRRAVAWSGLCNFLGVHIGGTAVAFSIVHLLPVELLVGVGTGTGMAMIFALLISAILWNLGTWWLGLPASSSHTLIGAILGVGLANSALPGAGHSFGSGVNWAKAGEVGLSLLLSPLIGFGLAGLLLLALKHLVKSRDLDRPPEGDEPPPFWVRMTLIGTCTGVSVAHGSNDGQKGIGLIMLILIGILPARYALDPKFDARRAEAAVETCRRLETMLRRHESSTGTLGAELADLRATLAGTDGTRDLGKQDRWRIRADILRADAALAKWDDHRSHPGLSSAERAQVRAGRAQLREATDYAPTWVTIAVAGALGLGTMVGWKRIVVTIGEKIGKAPLTYAQGAAAEVVAMGTIALADFGGLPVSTTHVLASGVAGTMAANGSGIQAATVRNIALAWLLTLPVAMALSACLFLAFRFVFAR